MKLFGPSEWAIRVWSALPALGSVLLVWQLGRLIYGSKAGLIAGLALATNVGFVLYVRKVSTDFLLVFALTLAMYGFVRHCLSMAGQQRSTINGGSTVKDHWGWARTIGYFRWIAEPSLLFWLGLALGVLSKGLIGLIFPLMIVAVYLLVTGTNRHPSIVNGQQQSPWSRSFAVCYSLFISTRMCFAGSYFFEKTIKYGERSKLILQSFPRSHHHPPDHRLISSQNP